MPGILALWPAGRSNPADLKHKQLKPLNEWLVVVGEAIKPLTPIPRALHSGLR